MTLDGEGVGLALQMPVLGEDQAVGVPEIRAEGDVPGVRKLRIQAAGRFGSTIPQRPSADFLGTSAKLACLTADSTLAEGDVWTQESIIGSKLTGTAHITAETG